MIGDDHVASLVVEPEIFTVARSILGRLDNEAKIDGETLMTLRSAARVVEPTGTFTHLGCHAGWTLVSAAGEGELGNPDGILMHVGHPATVEVAQALMPEGSEGITIQVVDEQNSVVVVIDAWADRGALAGVTKEEREQIAKGS